MVRLAASRIVQMLLVLWVVVTIVFAAVHLAPGDPTLHLALDPSLPPAARALQIERLGLDQPLHVQYLGYLTGVATGDLGVSTSLYPREVGEIIRQRLPRTIGLLGVAAVFAAAIGFVLGRWMAWRHGSAAERGATLVSVLLHTAFPPWMALLMIWLFAFGLGWFPSGRFVTPALWRDAPWSANAVFLVLFGFLAALVIAVTGVLALAVTRRSARARAGVLVAGGVVVVAASVGWWSTHPMRVHALDIAWHTALPTITLTLLAFGATALLTRTSMLETMQEAYVTTARAKGLPERIVRSRHVARTALGPIVASLVLGLGGIVTGSIVFEAVFSWPGLGLTFLDAAVRGDVPLTLGVLITYGVILLALHVVVDLLQALLDPRIRRPVGRTR
jgi:peptide/nickel transport system permease protein